eukprot:5668811-Pleurochrysis_carterae.AAC.1
MPVDAPFPSYQSLSKLDKHICFKTSKERQKIDIRMKTTIKTGKGQRTAISRKTGEIGLAGGAFITERRGRSTSYSLHGLSTEKFSPPRATNHTTNEGSEKPADSSPPWDAHLSLALSFRLQDPQTTQPMKDVRSLQTSAPPVEPSMGRAPLSRFESALLASS